MKSIDMMFPKCSLIVAVRRLAGGRFLIGQNDGLPWRRISRDLALFSRLTTGSSIGGKNQNAIVMGRKTYDTLPSKPLQGRHNWILSRNGGLSWNDIRKLGRREDAPKEIWVIGGAEIYNQCFTELPISRMVITYIERQGCEPACDTLQIPGGVFLERDSSFAKALERSKLVDETKSYISSTTYDVWECKVCEYELDIHPEFQYLDMIQEIIQKGISKKDRTGVGTIGLWGGMTRWNLQKGFPLLTTKRVFWKGVVEELLWFLQGQTDAKLLSKKGVKIWDANGSRDFLDKLGFTERREGDLGPVYGFQWRHFGAPYINPDTKPTEGIDQISTVLEQLKKSPWDRRCLVVAWNPTALREMALPPCHVLFQLQGVGQNTPDDPLRLNLLFYQRSCDMGLGVPFNIASYALLTHILAHMLGWQVGELVHLMGDRHVYTNHVEPLMTQLERMPKNFPELRIKVEPKTDPGEYELEDFELIDYSCHPTIPMEMAV